MLCCNGQIKTKFGYFAGFKTFTLDLQGDPLGAASTQNLSQTGTITGSGTITVTRIAPDGTAADAGDVACTVFAGPQNGSVSCSPSVVSISNGSTVSATFTISNFELSDDIQIDVFEG